ncbi:hypothetical protein SI65_04061 [Aspergillus cristatus]|uniref:Rhodopsin domain-containing protein n=1 Tax=Aspergillus cristatus TaxID=573508 RepID=A0A1E3BJC2_ASPCR|nr:hypothetical protein SI65_04061 [Aspergillus cristatus]
MAAVTLDMLNWGLRKHMWDVPAMPNLSPWFMKVHTPTTPIIGEMLTIDAPQENMIAAIFYCAATGFCKVPVLVFYLRIFPSRSFHIAVWFVVFIAMGYEVGSALANVFACTPIAKSWDVTIAGGSCMNRPVFYFANAGLGIFTDFATVLVPIPWLWKLQMPMRQKIAVGAILTMGCFVGVVSCIRLSTLYILMNSPDLTWATTDALMWCAIELNLGIDGGCVTAMRPFVRRYFPKLLGLSYGGYGSYSHSRKYGHPLNSIPRSDNPNLSGISSSILRVRGRGGDYGGSG